MKLQRALVSLVPALLASFAVTCGGSSSPEITGGSCVAGASAACAGPGGCTGFQTCRSDGSGYDPCTCGSGADGGGEAGVASDADSDSTGSDANAPSDGATATDSSADAAPWTPASLNGLVLWLDDTVGLVPDAQMGGSSVKGWLDQSGHGNNATKVNADGMVDNAALNGHDAVMCPAGGWFEIADAPSLQWGAGDFAITVVAKVQVTAMMWFKYDGTTGVIFSVDTGDVLRLLVNPNPVVRLVNPNPSKFHIMTVRGAGLQIRTEGQTASGVVSTTDLSEPGIAVRICQDNAGSTIEVAEMVAVRGTLSDPDLAKLENYLKTKFALP